MSAHEIVWEFDSDRVNGRLVCKDSDCVYMYRCDGDCEVIYDTEQHGDGYRHRATVYDPTTDEETEVWHAMHKTDECAFVALVDDDPDMIPELCDTADRFEIGRTAVTPAWQGEDGVLWTRA